MSPFREEKTPSFFVRWVRGHWLFKDFSSDTGGSIFDFVRIKENLGSFTEALEYLQRMVSPMSMKAAEEGLPKDSESTSNNARPTYDVAQLQEKFKGNDVSVCREYLLNRGIAEELIKTLEEEDVLLHNRYRGRSYCCFAVRNGQGELVCLDNHQVDGADKFVLGRKGVFSMEFEALSREKKVFVAEGIIDYLSVKTLEEEACWPGMALLGNQVVFDTELIGSAQLIVSALDDDDGGFGAFLDLKDRFPHCRIKPYALEGYNDPNELLVAVREGKGRRLPPERKLRLYQAFMQTSNKSELARKWGVDRSYMYEIAQECEKGALEALSGRRAGRKPQGKPTSLEEAQKRIEELEAAYEKEAREKELYYWRSEFLKLDLKWAKIEAAEARGEAVDESTGPLKKRQIKKNRKRRR
jgi:DNA primase